MAQSIYRRPWWRWGWLILALLTACAPTPTTRASAMVLTLDGPLTSGFTVYFERNLSLAARQAIPLVILQVNTPGGEITLMEDIITAIRNSPVPVVVYVTPRGAMAGSAGAPITLAGHASAMAPETIIGASSPVGGQGEDIGETMKAKLTEALKATVRGLAERRGPEAVALAEAMIEDAKAVTVNEAHEAALIDFVAADLTELLQQLDGFSVTVQDQPQTLATRDLTPREYPYSLVENVLNILTNSTIVYLLLSLGGLLILNEVSSPGGWVAGTLGVVCLALAFFGLGILPVNWFGLVFIGLAFVLFIMDIFATTHGALTAAAVVSLIAGGLILFNSPGTPEFAQASWPAVVAIGLAMGAAFFGLLMVGLRAQRRPLMNPSPNQLVGQTGEMRSADSAQVGGELWTVEAANPGDPPLTPGQKIVVAAVKGLRLLVRPPGPPE